MLVVLLGVSELWHPILLLRLLHRRPWTSVRKNSSISRPVPACCSPSPTRTKSNSRSDVVGSVPRCRTEVHRHLSSLNPFSSTRVKELERLVHSTPPFLPLPAIRAHVSLDGRLIHSIFQSKRKSASFDPSLSPSAGQEQQPSSKTRKMSDGSKPSITIPGPALVAARKVRREFPECLTLAAWLR